MNVYTLCMWAEFVTDQLCYVPSQFLMTIPCSPLFSIPSNYFACHLYLVIVLHGFSNEKLFCESHRTAPCYIHGPSLLSAEFVMVRDCYGPSLLWAESFQNPSTASIDLSSHNSLLSFEYFSNVCAWCVSVRSEKV